MLRGVGRIAALSLAMAVVAAAPAKSEAMNSKVDVAVASAPPTAEKMDMVNTIAVMPHAAVFALHAVDVSFVKHVEVGRAESRHADVRSVLGEDIWNRTALRHPPSASSQLTIASVSLGLRLRTLAWAIRHPRYAYSWISRGKPYSAI